jgi:hypothetical protein
LPHGLEPRDKGRLWAAEREFTQDKSKNPYLSYYEMQSVLSRSLEIYQRGYFGRMPKKITVHKNTPFKEEEIIGALDSFPDGTEVELVQIIRGVNWKGIRFNADRPPKAFGYPVERGTYIPIEGDEALLWTQGSVRGVNLTNAGYNIYKEGALKPTPSPILVRRRSAAKCHGRCDAHRKAETRFPGSSGICGAR